MDGTKAFEHVGCRNALARVGKGGRHLGAKMVFDCRFLPVERPQGRTQNLAGVVVVARLETFFKAGLHRSERDAYRLACAHHLVPYWTFIYSMKYDNVVQAERGNFSWTGFSR